MEAINDTSKLVAQALELLKPFQHENGDIDDAIDFLETAVERLAKAIQGSM